MSTTDVSTNTKKTQQDAYGVSVIPLRDDVGFLSAFRRFTRAAQVDNPLKTFSYHCLRALYASKFDHGFDLHAIEQAIDNEHSQCPLPISFNGQGIGTILQETVGLKRYGFTLDLALDHRDVIPFFMIVGTCSFNLDGERLQFSFEFTDPISDLDTSEIMDHSFLSKTPVNQFSASGKLTFDNGCIKSGSRKGFYFPSDPEFHRNRIGSYTAMAVYDPTSNRFTLAPLFQGMTRAKVSFVKTESTESTEEAETLDLPHRSLEQRIGEDSTLFYFVRQRERVCDDKAPPGLKDERGVFNQRSALHVQGFLTHEEYKNDKLFPDYDGNVYSIESTTGDKAVLYRGHVSGGVLRSPRMVGCLSDSESHQLHHAVNTRPHAPVPPNEPEATGQSGSDSWIIVPRPFPGFYAFGELLSSSDGNLPLAQGGEDEIVELMELPCIGPPHDGDAETTRIIEGLLDEMIEEIVQTEDKLFNTCNELDVRDAINGAVMITNSEQIPPYVPRAISGSQRFKAFETLAWDVPDEVLLETVQFKYLGTDKEYELADFYGYGFRLLNIQHHVDLRLAERRGDRAISLRASQQRPFARLTRLFHDREIIPQSPVLAGEFFGYCHNRGWKCPLQAFGQGPPLGIATEQIGQSSIANWLLRALNGISSASTTIVEYFSDMLKTFFDTLSSFVTSIVSAVVDAVWDTLRARFMEIFAPVIAALSTFAADAKEVLLKNKNYLVVFFTTVGFCILSSLGVVPVSFCTGVLGTFASKIYAFVPDIFPDKYFSHREFVDKVTNDLRSEDDVIAQGSHIPEFAIGLVSGVVDGITPARARTLGEYCRTLLALFATGTLVTKGLSMLFALLPTVLQRALVYKFGPDSASYKYDFEDWMAVANALTRVGKDERIIMSDEYHQLLKKCIDDAESLRRRIPPTEATNRAIFIQKLSALSRHYSVLFRYHNQQATRAYPYSLHLAGAPGVGKSSVCRKLISHVTGLSKNTDVYYKPLDKNYWCGYQQQKAVVLDEFLTSKDTQHNQSVCREYLELISNNPFVPEMPSLEDPSQGIKGTAVSPDIVISISNNCYDYVEPYISTDAFYRRRRFVIKCAVRPGESYQQKLNGSKGTSKNVDVSMYNDAELGHYPWMIFRLMDPYPGTPDTPPNVVDPLSNGWMTYDDLVILLATDYRKYRAESLRMARASGLTVNESRPPSEVLNEALADCMGLPTKKIGMADLLAKFIVGQGGSDESVASEIPDSELSSTSFTKVKPKRERKRPKKSVKFSPNTVVTTQSLADSFASAEEGSSLPDTHVAPEPSVDLQHFRNCLHEIGIPLRKNYAHEVDFLSACDDFYHKLYSCTECHSVYSLGLILESVMDHETNPALANQVTALRESAKAWTRGRPLVWNAAVGCFTAFAITCFALRFFSHIFQQKDMKDDTGYLVVGQSHSTNGSRTHSRRSSTASSIIRGKRGAFGQGPEEDLYHCRVTIRCADKGVEHSLNALPLTGRTILTYRHGFTIGGITADDDLTIILKYRGQVYVEKFYNDMAMTFVNGDDESMDLISYTFSTRTIPNFPNLSTKCIPENALEAFQPVHVQLYSNTQAVGGAERITGVVHMKEKLEYKIIFPDPENPDKGIGRKVVLSPGLYSALPSSPGDCGRAWIAIGGNYPGKVYGMHVAGTGTLAKSAAVGYALPLTKEKVEKIVASLLPVPPEIPDGVEVYGQGSYDEHLVEAAKLPNILEIGRAPVDIFVNRKTKFRKSDVASWFDKDAEKEPAVLSRSDKRSEYCNTCIENGETWKADPLVNQILRTGSVVIPDIADNAVLERCAEDVEYNLRHQLKWVAGVRELSFEEACKGIPGYLSSVNLNTSPGLPLASITKGRGKRDWVKISPEGELWADPLLRKMVVQTLFDMERGVSPNTSFTGFLKDELVRPSKIKEARTRVTYCGNLVTIIAFRMKIGSILAAFNNSGLTTSSAIGLNPCSFDMDNIYNYLTELETQHGPGRFQAGDFKDFDHRHHPVARKLAYNIIRELVIDNGLMTPVEWEYFYKHETESPAIVSDIRVRFRSNHYSGNFFTTVINNLVNEIYHRYCWYKYYPNLWFDDHVRLKVYGDDHLLWITPKVEYTGPMIAKAMEELGQVYTSDKKESEIVDYQTFEETTFLGTFPRYLSKYGRWVGCPKESILFESNCWTKDNDRSLDQRVDQSVALASLYPREYYDSYCVRWREALEAIGRKDLLHLTQRPYLSLQAMVANACAGGDSNFYGNIFPQGDVGYDRKEYERIYKLFNRTDMWDVVGKTTRDELQKAGFKVPPRSKNWREDFVKKLTKTVDPKPIHLKTPRRIEVVGQGEETGLTTVHDPGVTAARPTPPSHEHLALKAPPMGMEYGTESWIERTTVTWKSTDAAGHIIWRALAPAEILGLGIQENLQNMPFSRFTFWRGDVEVAAMVNGQQFQQGLLALMWFPLCDGRQVSSLNAMQAQHVLLSPNDSTLATVRAPFIFPATALNCYAFDLGQREENLGEFVLMVLAQLHSSEANTECTITLSSRFPDSKFTIPRPLITESHRNEVRTKRFIFNIPFGYEGRGDYFEEDDIEVVGQGGGQSTVVDNRKFEIGNIGGNVPIQMGPTNSSATGASTEASASMPPPMDAPPITNGSVPMSTVYPAMASSIGLKQTKAMDLHPLRMDRQGMAVIDGSEMDINYLCSKWTRSANANDSISVARHSPTFRWSVSDAPGTKMYELNLCSHLLPSETTPDVHNPNYHLPLCSAIMGLFTFWRCDFEFRFRPVRTQYHSGKIRAVVALAAPKGSTTAANAAVFQNELMDFSGENKVQSFIIPYNAATQFLRTWQGPGVLNPVQDYSLGTLSVFVVNSLRCPDTVANFVDFMIEVRALNVLVSIPRSFHGLDFGTYHYQKASINWPTSVQSIKREQRKTRRVEVIGQGDEDDMIPMANTVPTGPEDVNQKAIPSVLIPVEDDITPCAPMKLKIGDKFEYMPTNLLDLQRRYRVGYGSTTHWEATESVYPKSRTEIVSPACQNIFAGMFRAWVGSTHIRVIVNGAMQAIATIMNGPSMWLDKGHPAAFNNLVIIDGVPNVTTSAGNYRLNIGNVSHTYPDAGYGEIEFLSPAPGGKTMWGDFKLPFNDNKEFALNDVIGGNNIPTSTFLAVNVWNLENEQYYFQSFIAAGDDYRQGVFVPPEDIVWNPFIHASGTPLNGVWWPEYRPN